MITLNLTENEALALFAVLNCIGGRPKDSSRKYTDDIMRKLAHLTDTCAEKYFWGNKDEQGHNIDGAIYFRDKLIGE